VTLLWHFWGQKWGFNLFRGPENCPFLSENGYLVWSDPDWIALDQGYLSQEQVSCLRELALQISRMLAGLMSYLRSSELKGNKFR
jgi:hypothetical protein